MASQVEHIKWVPGTKFIVDGFAFSNPSCQQYFLTHCHSDHTVGLTKGFSGGTIWCSTVSARLLAAEWGLRAPCVRQLQLHQPVVIDGVTVTALDANHCPGAIMLMFEVPLGKTGGVRRILHTGDCRWHDGLYHSSCLAHKPVDVLMLDTTYALPKHTFPSQQESIGMMIQMMREALQEEPHTLLVVSCYHIGKERAYLGAAAALGLQVYVPPAKMRVLQLLDLPQHLLSVLSPDKSSQLHVGCTSLSPEELGAYLVQQQQQGRPWRHIMGFRATGWSYRRSGLHVQRPSDAVTLVGVPYSEHSSWSDLRQCVARLRPKRLIPTVNAATRSQQDALVDRFADLMDLSCDRGRMDAYLVRASTSKSVPCAAVAGTAVAVAAVAGASGSTSAVECPGTADAVSGAASAAGGLCSAARVENYCAAVWQPMGPCSSPTLRPDSGLCHSGDAQLDAGADASSAGMPAAAAAAAAQCRTADEHAEPLAMTSGTRSWTQNHTCDSLAGSVVVHRYAEADTAAAPCHLPTAAKPCPSAAQGVMPAVAPAGQPSDDFDLNSVDVLEQQRLLEDLERRKRLRRSLHLAQQSALQQRSSKSKGRRRAAQTSQTVVSKMAGAVV